MKLDRNLPLNSGRGKYALLLLRKLEDYEHGTFRELAPNIEKAISTLEKAGLIDWGIANTESEFFIMRLKDIYSCNALAAYAQHAKADGNIEWAAEVEGLCSRAGINSQWCKRPD